MGSEYSTWISSLESARWALMEWTDEWLTVRSVSHHVQVSLDPAINHDEFRVFSGFGAQLGPIVQFGAAGVIDGMAAFYPKTVVRLMKLVEQHLAGDATPETRAEIHRLQYVVSLGEEFVMRYGIVGIKEATCRVVNFGKLGVGRQPIGLSMPEGTWEKAQSQFLAEIAKTEASL
jgi:2-keto-3-deoxy-L-rhamnonate aldolase